MTAPAPRAYSIGRDSIRAPRHQITSVTVTGTTARLVTIEIDTPVPDEALLVGAYLGITGLGATIDGSWPLDADEANTTTSLNFSIPGAEWVEGSTFQFGYITYPANESYLRYPEEHSSGVLDTVLAADDALVFHAEPWDYHTTRLGFQLSPALTTLLDNDVTALEGGLAATGVVHPRIAVTRSSFGHPLSLHDGVQVVNKAYSSEAVPGTFPYDSTLPSSLESPYFNAADEGRSIGMRANPADLDYIHNYSDHPPDPGIPFHRDSNNILANSIYDEHLAAGCWYYYTLFVLLTYEVDSVAYAGQHWVQAATTEVLLPFDFKHRDTLYGLLPPWYQAKDQEFLSSPNQLGFLQKWMSTVGYDLDVTRTYAEGVQDLYNLDKASMIQVEALGEQNFGISLEGGLGEVNYRALVTSLNRLYDGRGNTRTIQLLSQAVSKFPTAVTPGINLMLLADDVEFAEDTGAWAVPYNNGVSAYTYGPTIGGLTYNALDPTFVSTVDPDPNLTWQTVKRGAMKITSPATGTGAFVLACGLGVGKTRDRYHSLVDQEYVPYLNGIRCEPGRTYQFSFEMVRETAFDGDRADIIAGIMWFRSPINATDPSVMASTDYLTQNYELWSGTGGWTSAPSWSADDLGVRKYWVQAQAPSEDPLIYAIPFLGATDGNSVVRYVSSCMFNVEMNTAQPELQVLDSYLTLGVLDETLDSDYVLGWKP